jgi:phosphoglycolate phosphatase
MNKSFKNLNHIIWDWNGTLFNDVELCAGIMNLLLTQESLPDISIERYKEIFTFPVIDYYKIAGHTFEKNSFEVLGKQFMDEYEKRKNNYCLFSGARELLAELKQANINQHLLSAYEQNSLNSILQFFSINSYFQYIAGLDNIYAGGKLHLAEKLVMKIRSNGKAGNILLIGDTLHDFEVAEQSGVGCILMAHGHQNEKRLLKTGMPVAKDFPELRNIIKELYH